MPKTDASPPLSLALLGYGKMGKAVAQLAPSRGFEVRRILDVESSPGGVDLTPANFQGIDVCIDFTAPEAVLENVRRVVDLGCNLVVGTTGWHGYMGEVRDIVHR